MGRPSGVYGFSRGGQQEWHCQHFLKQGVQPELKHNSVSSFHWLEAFSVCPHHGVHRYEGLGVFVFHNAQDLLGLAFVSYYHKDRTFFLGVPARAVDYSHAALHLVGDAVGHLVGLRGENESLDGLFVTCQHKVDAIAAHAHHHEAVDEVLDGVAHDEAAGDDDDVAEEDDAPLRDVTILADNHRNDVGAARATPLGEGHTNAQTSQAATEDGCQEVVVDERLHLARHHRIGDEMLQERHEHRSHNDGVARLDAEAHADDLQCDGQQYRVDDEHGDTRGNGTIGTPINQGRDATHASAHEVVRNEEGRPAQAHAKQREGDDDVTLYFCPNGFFVCFHF